MQEKKYNKKIAKKTAWGLSVLGIFMIIFVSISVYIIDSYEMDKDYLKWLKDSIQYRHISEPLRSYLREFV